MTSELEPLNSETHRDLTVGPPVRDGRNFVQIVASEFAAAASTCPILFSKSPETGQFYAGAMFGFRPEEPPLAPDDAFVPLDVERQAFFIAGEYLAIDPDHPRFTAKDGQQLFDGEGQPGDRLRRIQRALAQLQLGVEPTDAFIRALLDLKLIEPIDISLRFDDGETLQLQGLYTVARDSLQDLADAEALKLFRDGHLQLAHTMLASLEHIPLMASRRNKRLTLGL